MSQPCPDSKIGFCYWLAGVAGFLSYCRNKMEIEEGRERVGGGVEW